MSRGARSVFDKMGDMTPATLRSLGLASLMLGLAVGSIGRTLHNERWSISLSILSALFSIAAIGMFVRATPSHRRIRLIAIMVIMIGVPAAILVLTLRR